MSKLKKVLMMCTAYVLVAALAVGGTVAYLTDTDSDVNVMTLGNVSIEQHEYERVVDEDGKWVLADDEYNATFGSDTYTPDALQEYTQGKPALPAVYQDGVIKYDDRNGNQNASGEGSHQQPWSQVGAPGSNQLFDDSVKNVIDKFVFVENTGRTDAYYRTIIAIECPEGFDAELIGYLTNQNTRFAWENIGYATIDGVRYFLKLATYKQILTPGEISRPSLLQLFLDPTTTNEDCALFGETWEILVASQAVQADGFEDAETALNAAFGEITDDNHPWITTTEVGTWDELKAALAAGENVILTADIVGDGDTLVIGANNESVVLNLNGHSITNAVAGAPAIANYGKLTINGDGSIVNGVSDTKASHTIHNYGTLTVNGGDIGTFATSGAAVRNDGTTVINGGSFAFRQESNTQFGKGPAAYCLVNNSGTMTVNNATVNGPTHGIFAANAGELIVNGGNYTLIGNDGMGCYVAYAGSEAKIILNGGTVYSYEPRHNRTYYVYLNGKNYFDNDALDTGNIVVNGTKVYLNAKTVKVDGSDNAAVVAAINSAEPGDTVQLTEDTIIAGYAATNKLVIDKDIILDLNGKTLTTECGWGGIDAKGGCSIKNGTINHTGNTAAIKAFQVESIENVTINVTQTAGKTKGGIVVQEGAGCYVGSIKNVTITGATNGIETYRCGSRTDLAIGSMENVTIDATDTGILLSAPIGKVTNCTIEGDNIGVNMYLYGPYSVSMELVNSKVTGATGIYAHDEVGKTNPGSLTLTYDATTVINGGITQKFEDEVLSRVTVKGAN